MDRPLLLERLPGLEGHVDWMPLGDYPTPVERMAGLCDSCGLSDFYIKRDDLSSPIYGGNKVRKLEFLLAYARACGHDTLITFGAVGSNHVVATVIHGASVGLKTIPVLWPQPNAAYVRKNLLLDYRHGAEFMIAGSVGGIPGAFLRGMRLGYDHETHRFPYVIPPGGSNARGCLGHVDAALELRAQIDEGLLPEPEFIFVTQGSTGTAAGLILGCGMAGLDSLVVPVRVVEKVICNRAILQFHLENTRLFMLRRCPDARIPRIHSREILLVDEFAGKEYARFTPEAMEAVKLARKSDKIKLEGTYTGKTLAGALEFVKKHGLERRTCLFWNTFNSADLYPGVKDIDYHLLPTELQRYFEKSLQEEDMGYEVVY